MLHAGEEARAAPVALLGQRARVGAAERRAFLDREKRVSGIVRNAIDIVRNQQIRGVADETAKFAITEARVGRGVPWAVPLIHMLPQRILMEVAMTCDPLSAQRAYELGYVNRVTPPGQALQGAKELAARILVNAPLTVRGAKEMVRMATEMGRTAALRASWRAFDAVYLSEDALEGPRAFREKRKPQWKGR